jgi:hypothetical protein
VNRLLMLFAAALLLAGGAANADSLKGTYSSVGNDSCLLSNSPFSPGNIIYGGEGGTPPAGTLNGSAQGFAMFNGNGGGTITVNSSWVQIGYQGNTLPGGGG